MPARESTDEPVSYATTVIDKLLDMQSALLSLEEAEQACARIRVRIARLQRDILVYHIETWASGD